MFIVGALAVAAGVAGIVWSRRYCACLEPDTTARAIQALARANWRDLDRSAVARVWPGVPTLPCDPTGASGIEAFTAAIEKCCRTCGTCGGPYLIEEGDPSLKGLHAVGVTVCRRSAAKVLVELKKLVDAAVPPNPEATYERGGWTVAPNLESVEHAYRWRSGSDTFILEARADGESSRWVALFDLTRCHAVRVLEEWKQEDGSVVQVLRSEFTDGRTEEGRELWFSYLSRCLLRDSACRDAEAQRLWPRVRALAERGGASVVLLSAEDCKLGSITVGPRRKADGQWALPWSGCSPP